MYWSTKVYSLPNFSLKHIIVSHNTKLHPSHGANQVFNLIRYCLLKNLANCQSINWFNLWEWNTQLQCAKGFTQWEFLCKVKVSHITHLDSNNGRNQPFDLAISILLTEQEYGQTDTQDIGTTTTQYNISHSLYNSKMLNFNHMTSRSATQLLMPCAFKQRKRSTPFPSVSTLLQYLLMKIHHTY